MSIPRRAQQRDRNEGEIIAAFESFGWLVQQHQVWDLDVVCPRRSRCILAVEVKTPKGPLTVSQVRLVERGFPLRIVRSHDDVVALVMEHLQTVHESPALKRARKGAGDAKRG